jgi:hypothetical protein
MRFVIITYSIVVVCVAAALRTASDQLSRPIAHPSEGAGKKAGTTYGLAEVHTTLPGVE